MTLSFRVGVRSARLLRSQTTASTAVNGDLRVGGGANSVAPPPRWRKNASIHSPSTKRWESTCRQASGEILGLQTGLWDASPVGSLAPPGQRGAAHHRRRPPPARRAMRQQAFVERRFARDFNGFAARGLSDGPPDGAMGPLFAPRGAPANAPKAPRRLPGTPRALPATSPPAPRNLRWRSPASPMPCNSTPAVATPRRSLRLPPPSPTP
jgi:hypothetical protein